MTEKEFLRKFRGTPEAQKLLQTIRYAEGTAGPQGYQTMFGGGKFSDFSRHPDRVISSGRYSSAAAGAYQFLPGSYQSHAKALGLADFRPESQDLAALRAARNRLMPIGGLSVLQKEGLSPRVSAALAPEWASFPTESGRSYYGQPVKPLSKLQEVYGSTQVASTPQPQPVAQQATARQRGNFLGTDLLQSLLENAVPAILQRRSQLEMPGLDLGEASRLLPMPDEYLQDYIQLIS